MVGVTTVVAVVIEPGIHVYEVAPVPVKVAELPEQIAVGELTAVMVGLGFTVTKTVFEFVQLPFAPVTV